MPKTKPRAVGYSQGAYPDYRSPKRRSEMVALCVLIIGTVLASYLLLVLHYPLLGFLCFLFGVLFAAALDFRVAIVALLLVAATNGVVAEFGDAVLRPELLAIPLAVSATRAGSALIPGMGTPKLELWSLAVLIFAGLAASLLVAPSTERSMWIWIQLLNVVAVYFILVRRLTRSRVRFAVNTGTLIMALLSTISLLIYFADPGLWVDEGRLWLSSDGRVKGLSIEPNIFAAQAVGWLAIMFHGRHALRPTMLFFAVPIVLAIVLAGTRSAWIGATLLLAWVVARSYRRPVVFLSGGCLIFCALLLHYVWTLSTPSLTYSDNPLLWRLANPFSTGAGTGAYRIDVYDLAWSDIKESGRWMFGSGMNSYSQFHPVDPSGVTEGYLSSIWYQVLYDSGLLGLTAFIIFMLTQLSGSRLNREARPLYLVLLLSATTTNILWIAFAWIYLALVNSPRTQEKESELCTSP